MNDKNLWIAVALSALILILYDLFVMAPQRDRLRLEQETRAAAEAAQQAPGAEQAGDLGAPAAAGAPDSFAPQAPAAQSAPSVAEPQPADDAGAIAIDAASVRGRINLRGARIDELFLRNYTNTLRPANPEEDQVELLTPQGRDDAYYAVFGWAPASPGLAGAPGPSTLWRAEGSATLSSGEGGAVTLIHRTDNGLIFRRTVSVDEDYMFTITDTVANEGPEPATLAPYAFVNRHGVPDDLYNFFILHEGMTGVLDGALLERKYKRLLNRGGEEKTSIGGWVGITDKYWLTALAPPQDREITAQYRVVGSGADPIFQVNYRLPTQTVAPGQTIAATHHFFAGAKEVEVLRQYQDEASLGIQGFDRAIDWGHLFFLTKPFFAGLHFFAGLTGNYGVAILLLTLVIKLLFFPLANKSFESMSKMRKLQPKIVDLRERYKDDKMKMQQEMMALYKKEQLNPLAGCLPVLLQIPVFYALYKTLFVTIEIRHKPFFGWIQDLSAPDPTSIFNLFGLLPYDPSAVPLIGGMLALGVWPILMGVAMWFQMKLNPPPTDPVQQQVFALMPFFFMFLLARFPAGLVIYWTWNTVLSMIQQYVIMKRMGVEVDLMGRFKTPGFAKALIAKARGPVGDSGKANKKKP